MAKEGLGGEKTEKATPKKREDSRKKGNVLKSQEVNVAVLTLVMFGALKMLGPWLAGRLMDNTAFFLSHASEYFGAGDVRVAFTDQVLYFMVSVLPFLGIALVAGVAVNVAQVGFLFTTETLMPKFSKINPISGFKRLFSTRSLAELVKSCLKIAIIGIVIYNEYKKHIDFIVFTTGKNTVQTIGYMLDMVVNMGFRAGMTLCIIAALDYFYQWWRFEEDLKMTKQEIKEEYKMTEGNPEIKGKIKQKQRQMGMMRMMQAVPEADVVITNPTHYAVALKYSEGEHAAPVVIAKGQDYVAQKIKEAARESGVEIVENKPVAQALYRLCEIGEQIPETMYQAVAEILAYVMRLKKNRA